jgi:hypothetical protein
MALWQFIWKPHHWNKTEHGLTRLKRRRKKANRSMRSPQMAHLSRRE